MAPARGGHANAPIGKQKGSEQPEKPKGRLEKSTVRKVKPDVTNVMI